MRRTYTFLLIACLVPLSLWLFHPSHHKKKPPAKNATLVQIDRVKRIKLPNQISAIGTSISQNVVNISPEIAGQVANIYFIPGAYVKKGMSLIQLDSTVYKSELMAAKANLDLSRLKYKRFKTLLAQKLSSQQALDEALADLKDKESAVEVKSKLLEKMTLKAPFSGLVGMKNISIGEYVSVGQPLVTLNAIDKLKIQYNVPERYLTELKLKQKVVVKSDSFKNEEFEGKIDFISPTIDKNTHTLLVEALVDNKNQRLRAGLFLKVTHFLGSPKNILVVPEASLVPTINGQKVFIIKNNKAQAANVTIGHHYKAFVEIIDGLAVDDTIVVAGQQKLKDGAPVKTIKNNRKDKT